MEAKSRVLRILLLFSLPLYFFLSPAPSLVRPVSYPFLVRDLPPSSRSLSPFLPICTQFSLVSSFLPSSVFSRAVVGCRSVGRLLVRSVSLCVRQVRRFGRGSRSDERASVCKRVNERSRGHRARLPFTTVSFVLSLSFLVSFPRLSLFLSLSSSSLLYPAHTRLTQCCQKSGSSAPKLHAAAIVVTVWFSLAAR